MFFFFYLSLADLNLALRQTAITVSFCVAWSALDLAHSVLLMDLGLVVGLWEATEGNPTATPLLNKADTRTEPVGLAEKLPTVPHLSLPYNLNQGEARVNKKRPP